MENKERFDRALYSVSENIRKIFERCPDVLKEKAEEIRLRQGLPIALTVGGETVFIREDGSPCVYASNNLPTVSAEDLFESFKRICERSVYAHESELKSGFIIMKNGCRAGVFGTLNENGFMQDITCLNIRIAREIKGVANPIIEAYEGGGLLIAGPPASGKTTVLRDLCRQLSNGVTGKLLRVAVIDSRCELSGGTREGRSYDLGKNTDVLITHDKAAGIEIAVRTMFPNIVAFDEIGTTEELNKVSQSFFSGVSVITTAHISGENEIMRRKLTRELILSGAVSQIAVMPKEKNGKIKIFSAKELYCDRAV